MTEDNIAFRLKFLIENLGISSSQFADTCNISRPTLSQLLSGRNKKISDVIISQIHGAYPGLSILWLLFNEGNMWIGQPADGVYSQSPSNTSSVRASSTDNSESISDHEDDSRDTPTPETTLGICAQFNSKNADDIPENLYNSQADEKNSKENGLNLHSGTTNKTMAKGVNDCINTAQVYEHLANFNRKCRKVVQVTIYYDDSTFETFYPGHQ